MSLEIRRTGRLGSEGEDRCCAYDAVWKMLEADPLHKNSEVARSMIDAKEINSQPFNDLRILSMKTSIERPCLRQIMQGYGYAMRHLKGSDGKRIQKEDLLSEIFLRSRKGMFVCVPICQNRGVGHAIGIGKDDLGNGQVYDSSFEESKTLTNSVLNDCLGGYECIGMEMVVELVKEREKKMKAARKPSK